MRIVAAALTAAVVLNMTLLITDRRSAHPALACEIGPEMLDERVAEAQFIGLVEAVGVGGPENRAPTVTPEASASATRPLPSTPVSPPYSQPTPPPDPDPFQLSGIGASLRVIEQYFGEARDTLAVDDADRAAAEREWRIIQANPFPPRPCEPGLALTRYNAGSRYAALVTNSPGRGQHTLIALLVRGDEVDLSGVMMHGETYRRYFSGVPAEFSERGDAYLTAPRVPLATFRAAIIGMRGGDAPRIVPPSTGSAGLASGRQ